MERTNPAEETGGVQKTEAKGDSEDILKLEYFVKFFVSLYIIEITEKY